MKKRRLLAPILAAVLVSAFATAGQAALFGPSGADAAEKKANVRRQRDEIAKETFMRMASLGGGVGAGVKDLRVIFIFHDPAVMKQFVEQGVQFGGQADVSAKYQDTGVSGEQTVKAGLNYKDGTVTAGSSTDLTVKAAGQDGAAATIATRGGMEIYQFTESGVSLQATVSGTKYWKDSKLNN
jgi:lipid-binding SYLF domain-containing protein